MRFRSGYVMLKFRSRRWQSTYSHCLFLRAWRDGVLVSDFQMRDVVSMCVHGTLPKRNPLIQLDEKKMGNTFG